MSSDPLSPDALMLHAPDQSVQQEATTGIPLRPVLVAAPAHHGIAPEEKMLEPRDLAKELGLASAYALNRLLGQVGWQVQRLRGGWDPTPAGAPYAAQHAWVAEHGPKTGYNLTWHVEAVRTVLQQHGFLQS